MTALDFPRPRETAPDPSPVARLSPEQSRRLLSIAHRFLGCHHLAEDALQEALWELSQLDEQPERPIGWLTRAVIHRSRHLRRTARRRAHHEHVASQHCHLHGDCDNPLHIAIAHELGDILTSMRDALPSEQRRPFDLYTQGKDYRQIATMLQIPIGTVRSRLSRARQALSDAARERGAL